MHAASVLDDINLTFLQNVVFGDCEYFFTEFTILR